MSDKECSVVLFISRKKDNEHIEGFKKRKKEMLVDESMDECEVTKAFEKFVSEGLPEETSRFYMTVNNRDYDKVKKALIVKLLQDDNVKLTNMDSLVCSVAMKPENAAEKKWLLDYDSLDFAPNCEFRLDLLNAMKDETGKCTNHYEAYKTVNGWHIIVEHGFDCRYLLERYKGVVELKKDGMRLIQVASKEE